MTQAFNLSQLANNVNTSGLLNAAAGLYNQTPVANGGTGVATVASGNLIVGAGTAAMTALAGSSTGDVVTWSGTAWTAAASAGGPAPVVRIYTSPSPWTKSPTLKGVKVTVVAGGGSGNTATAPGTIKFGAGSGAVGIGNFPAPTIAGPVTVTVGSAGAVTPLNSTPGGTGGSSSFGALITATGGTGTGGPAGAPGVGGSITPSPTIYGVNGLPGSILGFSGIQPATPTPVPATFFQGGNTGFGFGSGAINTVPVTTGAPAAIAASGYGAGGASQTTVGLSGTGGIVIVEEFY